MTKLSGFLFLVPGLLLALAVPPSPAGEDEPGASTADHSKFEELQQEFTSGPEVTRVCLGCHTEAAKQLHKTTHWTWEFDHEKTGQQLGKRYVVNSFCGSITANYARCTSCHIGYGWRDKSFDFTSEENVDCLVCHHTTGTYKKFPTAAGHPAYEDKKFGGKKLFKAEHLRRLPLHRWRRRCGEARRYGHLARRAGSAPGRAYERRGA
mgnify:CR=1 FL=1